ncbi:MAG: phage holin family protein, partial [Pseudomonadota bacterium]|nr:phage holin family protein [Pseudomonadota bacterium]
GIAGLGVVLMGLAYLLGDAIDNLGLATLITGLATLGLAYLLYRGGAKKMSATSLAPDRTQRTLQRTPDAARGNLSSEHRS